MRVTKLLQPLYLVPMFKPGSSVAMLAASLLSASSLFAQQGFVHTSGTEIVDAQGKPAILLGINLGNWFEP